MFAVALDGPSGAGKSSIAKAAAKELGFVYVDTGALYRTIGLYLLEHGLDPKDPAQVEPALPEIQVELRHDPEGQKMFLCGREVTGLIRTPEVSMADSRCSAHPAVRAFLLELQRELAALIPTVKDPRVAEAGMISVTGVDAAADLKQAKVYVSVLDKSKEKDALKGLKSAAGWLRREVGRALTLRATPELFFIADDSMDKGAHILSILRSLDGKES